MKFEWSKRIVNNLKKQEKQELTMDEIENIRKKAVEDYLKSKEFEEEVNSIIKELGDEWFKTYKKENKDLNNDGEKILKEVNDNLDKNKMIADFEKQYEVEGFGQKPTIIELKETVK